MKSLKPKISTFINAPPFIKLSLLIIYVDSFVYACYNSTKTRSKNYVQFCNSVRFIWVNVQTQGLFSCE
jgi:hypothetical protein